MKLLIIEDDKKFLELVQRAIGPGEIHTAGTMKEALEIIDEHAPDVLVLDLGLPDSPTAATLERLRELKTRAKNAKLIVISGYAPPEVIADALKRGADQVFEKDNGFFSHIEGLRTAPFSRPKSAHDKELSEMERTVAQMVSRGPLSPPP